MSHKSDGPEDMELSQTDDSQTSRSESSVDQDQDTSNSLPIPAPRLSRKAEPPQFVRKSKPSARGKNASSTSASASSRHLGQSDEDMQISDQDDSDFDLASVAEALPKTKHKIKGENWILYDPERPENKNRLEIEAIIEKYDIYPESVTAQELERLGPKIRDWKYSQGVTRTDKKQMKGKLAKLNAERLRIRRLVGLSTRTQTYDPLGREIVGNPSLGKWDIDERLLKIAKKPAMKPITPPKYPKPNSSRTFYNVTSGKWDNLDSGEESDTGFASGASSSQVQGTISTNIQVPHVSTETAETGANLSENVIMENRVLLEIEAITPAFNDCSSVCSVNESLDYFKSVSHKIENMENKWVMKLNEDSTLQLMQAVIPLSVAEQMMQLNVSNSVSIIHINNAFLLDATIHCYFTSCLAVFASTKFQTSAAKLAKNESLVDHSKIMDMIMKDFLRRLQQFGIFLPPLSLWNTIKKKTNREAFSFPQRSISTEENVDDIVSDRMIPAKLWNTLYSGFLGKPLDAHWRVYCHYIMTYKDALGFLPNNSLNTNTYEALLTKLKDSCPRPHSVHFDLVLWSEIEPIMKFAPNLYGRGLQNCREFLELKKKFADRLKTYDGHLDYVFVTVPIRDGSGGQSILLCTLSTRRLEIFIPSQTALAFWKWMEIEPTKRLFALNLQYVRMLLMKLLKQEFWIESEVARPPQEMVNTVKDFFYIGNYWPFNLARFITSEKVDPCSDFQFDPINCAIWFETMTNPHKFEEHADRRKDFKHQIFYESKIELKPQDVRSMYFTLLNDMA